MRGLLFVFFLVLAAPAWAQSEPGAAFVKQREAHQKKIEQTQQDWENEYNESAAARESAQSNMDESRATHQKGTDERPESWWDDWATRQPYDEH